MKECPCVGHGIRTVETGEGMTCWTPLFDLTGKVAVVTGAGANGGLGHALALGLARLGADVAVPDIDEAGARISAQELAALGRKSLAFRCDVSNPEEVERLFAEVDRVFGKVDILINNTFAFPSRARPHELSLDALHKTLEVSLVGYFLCSQQAIRRMLAQGAGGSIVNISSIAGASGMGRGNFPYSMAKGGVNQLTRELAVEYAGQGIRVNAILPAQILTQGFKRWMADPKPSTRRCTNGYWMAFRKTACWNRRTSLGRLCSSVRMRRRR
jgi:NAD(P)-dependent dehydrogenase (short-subunit alcohol dehydrogenase family)